MADIANSLADAFRGMIREIVADVVREELVAFAPRLSAAAAETPKGKYLTKAESAKLAKCSLRTVELRMRAGVYRFTKDQEKVNGRVRILAEDVLGELERSMQDNRFRSTDTQHLGVKRRRRAVYSSPSTIKAAD